MPSGTNAGRALFINTMKKEGKPVPSISYVQTFQTTNANRALYISQLKKQGMPTPSISHVQTFQTGRAPPFNTALVAPHYQARGRLRPPPRMGILNAQSESGATAIPSVTGAISSITVPPPSATATTNAFDMMNRYMQFMVPDTTARILGMENIHLNVLTVLAYWNTSQAKSVWGNYTISEIVNRSGKIAAPWYAFLVDNIQLGSGLPTSLYFWGETPGINTVVTRKMFWKLYVVAGIRQNIRNRLSHKTGETFVPIASETGVLTEKPLISSGTITAPLGSLTAR